MSNSHLGLYIPVHLSLRRHPKIQDLCDILFKDDDRKAYVRLDPILRVRFAENGLGKMTCFGLLLNFWWYILEYYPNGEFDSSRSRIIEEASDWFGPKGEMMQILHDVGFITGDLNGILKVHDWDEFAGKLAMQREKNKEYQQKFRDKNRKPYVRCKNKSKNKSIRKETTSPKENKIDQLKDPDGILSNEQFELFETLWKAHPNNARISAGRGAKPKAKERFKELKPTKEKVDEWLEILKRQIWEREEGIRLKVKVPMISSCYIWLQNKRFDDDPINFDGGDNGENLLYDQSLYDDEREATAEEVRLSGVTMEDLREKIRRQEERAKSGQSGT